MLLRYLGSQQHFSAAFPRVFGDLRSERRSLTRFGGCAVEKVRNCPDLPTEGAGRVLIFFRICLVHVSVCFKVCCQSMKERAKALFVVDKFKQSVEIIWSHASQDALTARKGQYLLPTQSQTLARPASGAKSGPAGNDPIAAIPFAR